MHCTSNGTLSAIEHRLRASGGFGAFAASPTSVMSRDIPCRIALLPSHTHSLLHARSTLLTHPTLHCSSCTISQTQSGSGSLCWCHQLQDRISTELAIPRCRYAIAKHRYIGPNINEHFEKHRFGHEDTSISQWMHRQTALIINVRASGHMMWLYCFRYTEYLS